MPSYKETNVAGKSYQRCRSLYFENPKGAEPSVLLREERVTSLGDRISYEHAAEIIETFKRDEFGTEVQLYNPETDEPIAGKTTTYADIHIALFSLYRHLADKRDAAPPETEATS
jgi:hypothetical protein